MLPPISCAPCDPCCTTLYGYTSQFLELVQAGLSECVSCCDGITSFITVGPFVSRPTVDYLAVWLANVIPSGATSSRGAMLSGLSVATFQWKLMETGWPLASSLEGTIELPDTNLIHEAAVHSMAHAEAIQRSVLDGALRSVFGCGYRQMVPLQPVDPQGGMAGWTGGVQVDIEW